MSCRITQAEIPIRFELAEPILDRLSANDALSEPKLKPATLQVRSIGTLSGPGRYVGRRTDPIRAPGWRCTGIDKDFLSDSHFGARIGTLRTSESVYEPYPVLDCIYRVNWAFIRTRNGAEWPDYREESAWCSCFDNLRIKFVDSSLTWLSRNGGAYDVGFAPWTPYYWLLPVPGAACSPRMVC